MNNMKRGGKSTLQFNHLSKLSVVKGAEKPSTDKAKFTFVWPQVFQQGILNTAVKLW